MNKSSNAYVSREFAEATANAGSVLLDALRAEVEQLKRVLNERETLIGLLEIQFGSEASGGSLSIADIPAFGGQIIRRRRVVVDSTKDDVAFSQRIRDVLDGFADTEFDVRDVREALVKRGWLAPDDDPKAKIATVLARLQARDVIERTAEGAGSTPHKYRLTKPQLRAVNRAGPIEETDDDDPL